jgi:tight adherence protein C
MNLTVLLLIVGIGVLAFIAIFSIIYVLWSGRPNVEKRIHQQYEEEKPKGLQWRDLKKTFLTFLRPIGEIVPRSPQEMSRQERRLTQAGIRRRDAAILFTGAKLVMVLVFIALSVVAGLFQKQPALSALFSLLLGLIVPDIWLNQKISARKEGIQLALPDALDLMVMCVEAGLSLDQTLARISPELRGSYSDLSDEFQLYCIEVQAGRKRDDALRNLGRRSGTDDLKALSNALMQANRFGVAIAQSLRVFADSMRIKRRQRLEERAAKMSIKMLFPLVFCIFPAIFIVLIGPAVIQIFNGPLFKK